MLLLTAMIFLCGGGTYAHGVGTVKQFSELSGYSPAGSHWKSNFTIDWDTQYLLIKIDATGCTGTNENLFTLTGANVSSDQFAGWSGICASGAENDAVSTNAALMHAYYTSGNSTISHYAFDASRHQILTGVSGSFGSRSNIVYKISKADGVQMLQSSGSYATVATAATMTAGFFNSEMTIGSEEGSNRMHGTYTSVTIETIPPADAYITNVIPTLSEGNIIKELCPDGKTFPFTASGQFSCPFDIDWSTEKIVAQIDLSACSGENDFFAMTTGSGDFTSFEGTVTAPNLHCYFTPSNSYFSSYFHDSGGNDEATGTAENAPSGHQTMPSSKIVNLEFSKELGSVYNGTANTTQCPELRHWKTFYANTSMKWGNGQSGKNYNATYNYVRLVKANKVTTGNTIDESAKVTFKTQSNVVVKLSRTLSHDYWNTFCVPFAVSSDKVNDVFGANCEIREYNSMDGTTMNFKSASSIEAGKPYLIKPAADVTNPTFKGVSIVAGDPVTVPADGTYQMKGTYGLTDLATDGTNLFLGDQDKFYVPSQSGKTMKGMRAYFIVPSGTNAKAMRANIDGNVTAISNINGAEVVSVAPVYNLQGQYVGTSLNGLQRGIYVQNGKKIIVR